MHDNPWYEEEAPWIIWNSALGIRDFVTIGRVEVGPGGREAWLEEPYDMVGPFSLDELARSGRISFAACVVMSRQKWRDDQAALRRDSFEKRRAAQERLYEELARSNRRKRGRATHALQFDGKEQRKLLELPVDGALEPSQIKAAFRRIARKAHPDVGGSHEQFVRITEARDMLLECFS